MDNAERVQLIGVIALTSHVTIEVVTIGDVTIGDVTTGETAAASLGGGSLMITNHATMGGLLCAHQQEGGDRLEGEGPQEIEIGSNTEERNTIDVDVLHPLLRAAVVALNRKMKKIFDRRSIVGEIDGSDPIRFDKRKRSFHI